MSGQILLVPCCEPGRGGGHLGRLLALTFDLRAMGREAWLYLEANAIDMTALFNSMNFNSQWRITENELERVISKKLDFIVLDRFQTPKEEFIRYRSIAPIIGIDEGGPCRDQFDFLIDILVPKMRGVSLPNLSDPSLLKFFPKALCEKRSSQGNSSLRVLVSFGREDAAGLGLAAARALSHNSGSMDITLLKGGMGKNEKTELPNVRVIEMIPNLDRRLGEYDLLVTHYGITAYEALYVGTPVVLVSPTAYHEKIARAAGFYSFLQ